MFLPPTLMPRSKARCYTAEDLTRLGARAVSLDVRERLHGKPGLALLGVAS